MAATRSDLIRQVLEDLAVIDAISNPDANDSAAVDRRADRVTARLRELGLCWWDEETIPDAVMPALGLLVANEAAPTFGKGRDMSAEAKALRDLAKLKNTEERPIVRTEFF